MFVCFPQTALLAPRWRHMSKTGCSAEALEQYTKDFALDPGHPWSSSLYYIHDILASDPLPVAVMVLWDPDFFLAYAQRGMGALHSWLALIGSDLLSFLQSVVLRCCLLSVSQEKLGLAQEKEVLLEDCHFTPQAQRSASSLQIL